MRFAGALAAVLVFLAGCGAAPVLEPPALGRALDEAVVLAPGFRPGMRFRWTHIARIHRTRTIDGDRSEFDDDSWGGGTIEVIEARGGIASAVRIEYDRDRVETEYGAATKILVGRAFVCRASGKDEIAVDGARGEGEAKAAKSDAYVFLNPTFFPGSAKPLKVGDAWKTAQGGGKVTLVAVREAGGRRVAELATDYGRTKEREILDVETGVSIYYAGGLTDGTWTWRGRCEVISP